LLGSHQSCVDASLQDYQEYLDDFGLAAQPVAQSQIATDSAMQK
jgi:hypothetical protein